ncbi:MAG: ABC transporter ATP-binding protein [Gammaproteobacteria bacterium]|nr:ABC transporter ATP-binding protein [Gammaproteobacteria bacterium]
MNALITTSNLNHYYGSFHAVQDLSLELQRGEILGLLGPNGAGKSTSMRIISGNTAPTSGSVQLNGVDLHRQPLQAKASLGYLPEQPPLYRDMTIGEYLDFCAHLHQIPRPKIIATINEAMEKCGLKDMQRRLIGNLSKGYQQRVGIAQAIIHQPDIIILDEPTSGLDPNQIMEIRDLIRELGDEHGVILSTHILPEVQSICSRVMVMNKGRVIFSDSMSNITDSAPSSLLFQLEQTPMVDEISTIPGVATVETLPDGHYRAELKDGLPLSEISEQLVAKGWGLSEFTPERHTLEQVFARLTMDEEG